VNNKDGLEINIYHIKGYIMSEKSDGINKKAEIANQAFWDEMAPIHCPGH